MSNVKCPRCKSYNVTTTKVKVKSGDKVTAIFGVAASLGVAALVGTAAPILAPVTAVLGVKGVEHLCHHGFEKAVEAGKDKYVSSHICKNCGHRW